MARAPKCSACRLGTTQYTQSTGDFQFIDLVASTNTTLLARYSQRCVVCEKQSRLVHLSRPGLQTAALTWHSCARLAPRALRLRPCRRPACACAQHEPERAASRQRAAALARHDAARRHSGLAGRRRRVRRYAVLGCADARALRRGSAASAAALTPSSLLIRQAQSCAGSGATCLPPRRGSCSRRVPHARAPGPGAAFRPRSAAPNAVC